MATSQSGDVGLCRALGHTSSLIRTWENHTVIDVDCNYKKCGYADICEMYQRMPVGYRSVPSTARPEAE